MRDDTLPSHIPSTSVPATSKFGFSLSANWLRRDQRGRDAGDFYPVFFEIGRGEGTHLRIRRSDLVDYPDAGFPIIIAPRNGLSDRQLEAIGRRIGGNAVFPVVTSCHDVAAVKAEEIRFAARSCDYPRFPAATLSVDNGTTIF